jgi:5-(carboxyamino)imidazole ribonucleotide synthase
MILPGSTLGILGGGQLARMTALAARRMGYRFRILDPAGAGAPASAVVEHTVQSAYDDPRALEAFGAGLDVASIEFENIPVAALQTIERFCPVRPGWRVLEICQHREREKLFLQKAGYPHAGFQVVTDVEQLADAVASLGCPCVLKTAESGYDGKGQLKIDAGADLNQAWQDWSGGQPRRGVVEAWVDFTAELSVICARNGRGEAEAFPVFENIHHRHILDMTIAPARFAPAVLSTARDLALSITEALDVQGLLAVELFLTSRGDLIVNELAPRPHNSGHLTFDAGLTSQFEQHARAVCDLPLGSPALLSPAVMVNLLGDLWSPDGKAPDWRAVFDEPAAKLHLYDKARAKPGRKMGHFCVLAPTVEEAMATATVIKERLTARGSNCREAAS